VEYNATGGHIVKYAPIALFVFNRPQHTERILDSLKKNTIARQSKLLVFSDGPRNSEQLNAVLRVREIVSRADGFQSITVHTNEHNLGLAESIIQGMTVVLEDHNHVIILEDDLEFSPYFLSYMNEALTRYQNHRNIFSISGYNLPPSLMPIPASYQYDVYCNLRSSSWGWGTWKDRFERVDWNVSDYERFTKSKKLTEAFNRGGEDLADMLKLQQEGKIDSWAIRWVYAQFKNMGLSITPIRSYVNNIGHDGTGTHCCKTDKYVNDLSLAKSDVKWITELKVDEKLMENFCKNYAKHPNPPRSILHKVKQKLTNLLSRPLF